MTAMQTTALEGPDTAEVDGTDALVRLRTWFGRQRSVVVAFSGGADSAFVAWVATEVLGPERVHCATAVSPSLPDA